MKKAMILSLVLMMLAAVPAAACELPNIETGAAAMSGAAWWVISGSHHVMGRMNEKETLQIYPAQNVEGAYITGAVETGLIREKGEMRYMAVNGSACGLTRVEVTVSIRAEYMEEVRWIVARRMGEGAAVDAGNVIACTIRRTQATVCHYFFSSTVDRILIGTVTVNNGRDAFALYMGDWTGDGLPELGFAAGYIVQQYKTPEKPQGNPQNSQSSTQSKDCGKKGGCTLVIQVNAQININSTVTNNQNVNINNGCNKNGHMVNCVK